MTTPSLPELRRLIDDCNVELLRLLNRRTELALQAIAAKGQQVDDLFDPGRQAAMLARLVGDNPGPLGGDAVAAVFGVLFERILDRMQQREACALRVHRGTAEPDRIVMAGGQPIGASPLFIAGPCAVESEAQLDAAARVLAGEGVRFLRGGVYKPRTSPYAFQGLGDAGLPILRSVAARYGMATVAELTDARQIDRAAPYVDLVQVGARNMDNYELLRALGQTRLPVLLKRHFAATVDEFLLAAEYLLAGGNPSVVLCERGIRTFARHARFTPDLAAVPVLRLATALPVIVDVSHAAGRTDILLPLVAAALSAGAQGILIEVHPDPPHARSDATQQLTPDGFVALRRGLRAQLAGALHLAAPTPPPGP